jgi:hypothetical protein
LSGHTYATLRDFSELQKPSMVFEAEKPPAEPLRFAYMCPLKNT